MLFKNLQVYYYLNGRQVLSQSGETDIKTIESNKFYLQKMFGIYDTNSEIEVIAKPNQELPNLYNAFV